MLIGPHERHSRGVLGRVVSAVAGEALAGIAEPELDIEIGGTVVQQADGFGDNETGGGCADEGHGDRLAGEVAPPAIIAYELPIARILTRHPHVIGGELRFLFFARVRPQIVRRARIGERVQADRVEIAGHATEAAVDDAAELRVGKVPARRI